MSPEARRGKIVVPANPSAFDSDGDFALLEAFSFLDTLQRRSRLRYPQLVFWIRKDTNIGLREGPNGILCDGGHAGLVLRV
jgi:hypothetical protein